MPLQRDVKCLQPTSSREGTEMRYSSETCRRSESVTRRTQDVADHLGLVRLLTLEVKAFIILELGQFKAVNRDHVFFPTSG